MFKFIRFRPSLALVNCSIILFVTMFSLATPALFKLLVEGVLPEQNMRAFIVGAIVLGFICLGRFLFGVCQDYIFLLHRQMIETDALAGALQRQDLKSLNMQSTFSVIRNFVSTFQYFWIEFVFYMAYAVYISAIVLAAFYLIEPLYFWISLGFMLLHGVNFWLFRPHVDRLASGFNARKAQLLTEVSSHLKLLQEIKSTARESFLEHRVRALADTYSAAYRRKEYLSFIQRLVQNSLINVFYMIFFMAALIASIHQETSIGSAALCIFLSGFLFEPIYRFSTIVKAYFDAKSYTAWVPNVRQILASKAQSTSGNELILDQVMTHPMVQRQAQTLNLVLKPGQLYLIKGPSGSGKSTLLDCIAGLDQPVQGSIRLADRAPLKQSVYYCEQSAAIFPGSIVDNLTFYEPNVVQERVRELIDAVNLGHVYLTHESANDVSPLSGGQKQRLSLARSFYCGQDVILYDEPTSALDEENERRVLEQLAVLSRSKIVVMVSHSAAAERYADRVIDISAVKPSHTLPIAEAGSLEPA